MNPRFLKAVTATALLMISIALPDADSPAASATGEELARQALIRRDSFGIPHILARSEEAAAFAFGYAQAEDHCLQIARAYVSARGEEARTFGTGIESDLLVKLYDVRAEARTDLRRVGSTYRKIVNAFAEGINRYVEQHRAELPPWIPRFTGEDVMASRRAGAVRTAFSQGTVRALQRKYAPQQPSTRETSPPPWSAVDLAADEGSSEDSWPREEQPGSNAFALAGSRTTSGKPILLGNPHLNWSSLYWEAHVTVPGKIDFFGSTLAGIPILRAGFNERLGWVTTNNSPDVSDVYALPLDPLKLDHYIFNGKSRPLTKREISAEVKNTDGSTRTETKTYWESHLGKILYRTADKVFAVTSTQIDAFQYYEGFYTLSKARNLKQWLSVMKRNMVPTSNFTYADVDGNILYVWNARVAKRPDDGTDYSLDIPAETGRYVWRKLMKFSEFPRLLNPSGGYIQNCNNPPWYTSLRNPIDPRAFPSWLEEERGLALRPQIALEMLAGREKHSFDDVVELKYNTRMLLADRVKPDLVKSLRAVEQPSEEITSGLKTIEAWDNRVSAGSRGAVLFQRFWDSYAAGNAKPYAVAWDASNPAGTPSGISDAALAIKRFEDAVKSTRAAFGSEAVAWGDVHRYRFAGVDLPGDGANGTYGLFRVMRFIDQPDGKRVAGQVRENESPIGFGDAWVLAVEFTQPIRAQSIVAYGQTTRTASRHSSDQIGIFAGHKLRPVWFSEAEIRANLEREYHP